MQLLYYTIHLAGILQALFFGMVLFVKKENRYANRILSIIFFIISGDFLESILININIHNIFPLFPWNTFLFPYIFGPLFFLYVSVITGRIKKVKLSHVIHFIPAIIIIFLNLYSYYTTDISIRLHLLSEFQNEAIENFRIIHYFGRIYEFSYYFYTLIILYFFRKRIKDFFSDITRLTLRWLHFIIFAFIIIEALLFLMPVITSPQIIIVKHLIWIMPSIAIITMFVSALIAVIQPDLLNEGNIAGLNFFKSNLKLINKIPKYEKLRLDANKENNILDNLLRIMSEQKPYLNEHINLNELAAMLNLDPNRLSMILNIHLKHNFYTFINKYRIEEVKKKFSDPEYKDENILTIAFDSGFNSKSSFNNVFKKITCMTPRGYRKIIKNN
jgi:AraC-like DNA-binding protein